MHKACQSNYQVKGEPGNSTRLPVFLRGRQYPRGTHRTGEFAHTAILPKPVNVYDFAELVCENLSGAHCN
jgi:hypothetical protein